MVLSNRSLQSGKSSCPATWSRDDLTDHHGDRPQSADHPGGRHATGCLLADGRAVDQRIQDRRAATGTATATGATTTAATKQSKQQSTPDAEQWTGNNFTFQRPYHR